MFNFFRKNNIEGEWRTVAELEVGQQIAVPRDGLLEVHQAGQINSREWIGEDDILWDEIESIKYVGTEQVWDIEVEGTHNFIGNNIFAHNTYINGNVGIGTTDISTYNLNVNGTGFFATSMTTAAVKITTGATDGYFLRSDADGDGVWTAVAASQVFKGTWDASTNTPTLADGVGTAGWFYRTVVAGTVDFGAGNITFAVGDDVSYSGTVWQKIPGQGYTLQAATASVLGGIKVGGSLQINSEVLNVNNADMGDITVSGTGSDVGKIWTIDNSSVTYAKIQNISAQYKVLGRTTAGAGVVEELSMTGTGSVAMSTSPSFTTPTLGVAIGTSLALGGATIGSNALAVTGSAIISGNVGIGTTDPGAKLEVVGATQLTQPAGSTQLQFKDSTNSKTAYVNYNNDILQFFGNGPSAERLRFDLSTGNVGIGDTNPRAALQVTHATTTTSVGEAVIARLEGANAANSRTELGFNYFDSPGFYSPVVLGYQMTTNTDYSKGNFYIATRDATTDTVPTERLTIAPDGAATFGSTITAGTYNAQTISSTANFTGSVAIAGAVTGATSYNGLVITANTGVITTGTWNGTAIANANLANSSLTYTAGTGLTGGGAVSLGGSATLNIGAGTCITSNADDVAVTADCIGDTQLAFNTGQHLTTTSAPTFAGLTSNGNIIMSDGATIGQTAGPLMAFDDTNNYLEITGASVGIGTTAPAQLLNLYAAGPAKIRISADSDNVTETDFGQIEITQDGVVSTGVFGLDGTNDMIIGPNSTTAPNIYLGTRSDGTSFITSADAKLTILNAGNVGIGTTAPGARLHVSSANVVTDSLGNLEVMTSDASAGNKGGQISLGGLSTIGGITAFGTIAGRKENIDPSDQGYLAFGTSDDEGTNIEHMRIDAAGSVGIGTTAPLSMLHVGSDATAYANANVARIANNNGEVLGLVGSTLTNINFYINGTTARKATIQSGTGGTQGGTLSLWTKPDSAGDVARAMTIIQTGSVGIGTATPDSIKLDVEDDIEIGTGTTGCVRDADNTTLVGSCVSDERLKKNITTLSADTLEKITRLRPVTFEWRNDEYSWLNGQSGVNYGLIAQEVEQVFPDMVNTDEKGFKRVSYDISLTMRLLEAVQELYTKLFALKDEMLALKNTVLAFADRFVSREIVATEKICIGATCMNEQQLIDLLASTGVVTYAQTMEQPIPSEPADSTATSSPASDGTSGAGDVATTTESVVEEPVASSTEPVVEEPVVEVVSEPAPEPAPEPTPTEPAGEPVAVTQ